MPEYIDDTEYEFTVEILHKYEDIEEITVMARDEETAIDKALAECDPARNNNITHIETEYVSVDGGEE